MSSPLNYYMSEFGLQRLSKVVGVLGITYLFTTTWMRVKSTDN